MPIGIYERTSEYKKKLKETAGIKTRARHEQVRQEKITYINQTGLLCCNKCKEEKSLTDFTRDKKRWSGRRSQCKACDHFYYAKKGNEYYHINKEKISQKAKWYRRKAEFNFTKEDYYKMLSQQQGVCAICHAAPPPNKLLYIDHNHKTQKVRGLLCQHCNSGLGMMRDNITICRNAALYLEQRGFYGKT